MNILERAARIVCRRRLVTTWNIVHDTRGDCFGKDLMIVREGASIILGPASYATFRTTLNLESAKALHEILGEMLNIGEG